MRSRRAKAAALAKKKFGADNGVGSGPFRNMLICGAGVAMSKESPKEITGLLQAWGGGDRAALDELIPLVYDELHRAARRQMRRESADNTIQATALVNEVYMRLVEVNNVSWQDRAHFFAISARLMRQILVDLARRRNQLKRGGQARQVSLHEATMLASESRTDLAALDDALKRLETLDSRQSQIVELRFFGGLTEEEIGEVLGVSPRTVRSDWSMAKVWLLRELSRKA
jgi:RNA polymerase sigma factor (TIGR02999 family)